MAAKEGSSFAQALMVLGLAVVLGALILGGGLLFPAANGRPLTASAVRKKLVALGARADVANSYPHRFRHTFAIQYLRNGGDVFTLQAILGHTTMTMVRRYLHLAASDVEQAHRRASPVDNWLR